MSRAVKYSVKLSERWQDVAPFFEAYPDALAQVCSVVGEGKQDFYSLTVRGMLEAVSGQVPNEWKERYRGGTVGEWCAMLNALNAGISRFTEFMENTTPKQTNAQKKMLSGTLKSNLEEAVLMTLKSCFSLHDLEAATNLTVYEYMMARKDSYNEAMVYYNKCVAAGLL